MPAKRMNRDEFHAKLAGLGEDDVKKILWNLYWRGTAAMRERIEDQIDPPPPPPPDAEPDLDTGWMLDEVTEFAELARSGSYLGGDRRVPPKERSRWRFTFRRLAGEVHEALVALPRLDDEQADETEQALGVLLTVVLRTAEVDMFRSEDPVQAAGFVVSDHVEQLWTSRLERDGFAGFAAAAARQLERWEATYGWTRMGHGSVADKERSLAEVVAGLLRVADDWERFAGCYLEALDALVAATGGAATGGAATGGAAPRTGGPLGRRRGTRSDRSQRLAVWHQMLLEQLAGTDADGLLDRLVAHPALGGPEHTLLQARLAAQRGDTESAHALARQVQQRLPGHPALDDFGLGR